jgi:fatty-acyl-CoA synthase
MTGPALASTMMDGELMLDAFVERAALLFPKVEVVCRRADKSLQRHGYAEIAHRARSLAAGLQKAGLREGDRVATLMWNHHFHLEAYFGIPMAGGVYHTLNLRLPGEELSYIVNHAKDRFLLVDDLLLPLLAKIPGILVKDGGPIERVFVADVGGVKELGAFSPFEDLVKDGDAGFVTPRPDERRAAGLCYTSGTTGKPKGVLYSHRSLVLHTLGTGLADAFGICQRDTVLPVVPMFHANAWGLAFTATMAGAKLVLPGPMLDPESLLDLYEKERVTFSAGVPTIWLGILQALDKEPKRWSLVPDLRMVVGGAAAPESLIRGLDKHGLRVIHAWGMTETSPMGSIATIKASLAGESEDVRYKVRAKQGMPVPFVEIRARGDEGIIPWDGKAMGELEVRGPWVAASYYDNDEALDRWTADGWFRTGDVVTIDAEGYVTIADRTKDLIKSGGEWISSVALENALMGHPAIKEAAAFAIPDEKWSERPAAAIVWKPDQKATKADLLAFLAPHFAKWALPDVFVVMDIVPRNSTGKFLKTALRDMLADPAKRTPLE